jgi:hypothetical protein
MTAIRATAIPSEDGFVRLVASTQPRSTPSRLAALLGTGPVPWAARSDGEPGVEGMRTFALDLSLRLRDEPAVIGPLRKSAYLDLGWPRRNATGWEAEISWRAATAAPLFPVFSGWLTIGPDRMQIDGLYAPPGGVVGRVADRILLHVAANATARWLLAEIDRAALALPG